MTKPTKLPVRPMKTQISLSIHPVWSESSLSAWRSLWSLATHGLHCKVFDQTGRIRVHWVHRSFCWLCRAAAHLVLKTDRVFWSRSRESEVVHFLIMYSFTIQNWASFWDYGTYHIGDQRRLRWACTSAQSHQSLRCSQPWSMEVDEGADQKSGI